MGDVAESMLDGSFCQQCGEYLGAPAGYPRSCEACGGGAAGPSYGSVKRHDNMRSSVKLLRARQVPFTIHNNGYHLIIKAGEKVIDFYPTTGLYRDRAESQSHRGVFNPLKHLGKEAG
jgi:hypothetical protein